ncbi:MAG: tRNA pseudouridine(38-40) synthase TruA [Spirochaetes bacterium GWB1_48_6]|nr:MAG: tRNA pseudouridine(38-40) synthase TruA [Spirochaetes bacterium GWB1_48_6]
MDLSYDGTNFEGWQTQLTGRTVQGVIEKALGILLKTPVSIMGAGRTDAGVHARHQVAHFSAETRMEGKHFTVGLNSLLPKDVRILEVSQVDADFHARFSAKVRVYHYYFFPGAVALPWEEPYCWRLGRPMDLQVLNTMAGIILGEQDFTTFSCAQDKAKSRKRFIHQSIFYQEGPFLVYRIAGNAFLWRMVRSLVGSMIKWAPLEGGPEIFRRALEAKCRDLSGPSAPAKGLFLQKVVYHDGEWGY